eukprot:GHRR01023583.1.p1 GENE.GHRR01023583.1~~GHRR01023583.1.p1  ORF type:complete len:199 (+),score=78.09 GHRR01023583.1:395-991(+)
MKFGKLLKETTEGMGPEMEDLFVRYKELKKHLKAMKKQQKKDVDGETSLEDDDLVDASASGNHEQGDALSAEEMAFVNTLNEDLLRFNRFFIDKEEDSVIKLQALSDRIKGATGAEELQALKAELVDFHGEMVLLLHWSLLNYAAVVKILKKHGACLCRCQAANGCVKQCSKALCILCVLRLYITASSTPHISGESSA